MSLESPPPWKRSPTTTHERPRKRIGFDSRQAPPRAVWDGTGLSSRWACTWTVSTIRITLTPQNSRRHMARCAIELPNDSCVLLGLILEILKASPATREALQQGVWPAWSTPPAQNGKAGIHAAREWLTGPNKRRGRPSRLRPCRGCILRRQRLHRRLPPFARPKRPQEPDRALAP